MKCIFFGVLGLACMAASCQMTNPCPTLEGVWTNKEGQELVFLTGDSVLWLTRFGSIFDTIHFRQVLHCQKKPAWIEWSHFSSGPYSGKILYGILESLSDSSFRVRYEPGTQEQARPQEFDNEQTIRFVKKHAQ